MVARAPPSVWFLRSRGDAPSVRTRRSKRDEVPPLTRRCAVDAERAALHLAGSSAHAEMRRRRRVAQSGCSWFLRSRGDAPGERFGVRFALEVPPLTRRCAENHLEAVGEVPGSSAHAEMRPIPSASQRSFPRFLRSRGDAPADAHRDMLRNKVPPLTRRCAAAVFQLDRLCPGSSAHAEMRPQSAPSFE